MPEIRIIPRCSVDPNHAKILRLKVDKKGDRVNLAFAKILAHLIDGTSPMYIYPPQDGSPMGFCCKCGGKLTCSVEEK